jgi:hypothetical protein
MERGFERDHADAKVANEAGKLPPTPTPDLAGQVDAARRMGDEATRDSADLHRARKRRADRDEARDAGMTEEKGENVHMKQLDVRMNTAEDDLRNALYAYVRNQGKSAPMAIDAYRAVRKSLGLPEDPPTR